MHPNKLDEERQAAKMLALNIKAILGDDEQALLDAIEGETEFKETVLAFGEKVEELKCLIEANVNRIGKLNARNERYEAAIEAIKHSIGAAMLDVGLKSIRGANLTISARHGDGKIDVVSEEMLPDWAWKEVPATRRVDKIMINERSKTEHVPGTVKTNGKIVVTFRT